MKFRIKEARELAGFSQKEMAELIGVAPNTFHGYESGKHDPKSDLLIKIADACNVSTDFLLDRKALETEKSPDTTIATSGDSEEDMVLFLGQMLTKRGYMKPGEKLADSDYQFLAHLVGLMETHFEQRRKG